MILIIYKYYQVIHNKKDKSILHRFIKTIIYIKITIDMLNQSFNKQMYHRNILRYLSSHMFRMLIILDLVKIHKNINQDKLEVHKVIHKVHKHNMRRDLQL